MSGPVQNDSQYKQLPTLVIPSSISGKMGQFNSGAPPVTGSRVNYNSGLFQNQGGVTRPPMISPGNRSVVAPNSTPVTYNPGLFPQGAGGIGGVTGPQFANQNTDTSYGGQQDMYRGGKVNFGAGGVTGAGVSAGGGVGAADNTHPEEKRWKILAEKYGVNWDVTKNIYMRSPRNPGFDPAVALNLQLDDKAFGDAAMRAGVLTGNADYDRNVWDDWYNANGNIERSPLAGHNYAIMDYEANQARAKQMVNGTPQPPEWL
jgi:hypothetical protein